MNGQQAWIFPASSISALKESISFTATRNQQGHVMNEAWNPRSPQHFCTTIVWGQILSSFQERKTSWIERAWKSGKPHRQPSNSLCRALGSQLSPAGMGNESSVSAERWKQPWDCREEVCLPLFWGPHASHKARLPSWKTTGTCWKINTIETERTAILWTLQHRALGAGGGEVSQSIHGCHWQ